MTDRIKKWIYITAFLDLFAVSLIVPSMSAHLKALGASYFMIGFMNSTYACMQFISGPIVGSWSDKIGRQKIFIVNYLIVALCYLFLGFPSSLYIILLLRATIGVFKHGQTLIRTIITDRISTKQQAPLFGRLKSVAGISFTFGPAIGGHLTEFDNGFRYISCCAGILLAINSVIGYMYFQDLPNNNKYTAIKKYDQETTVLDNEKKLQHTGITDAIRGLANVNWLAFGDVFLLKFILDMSASIYHSNYNINIQERFELSPKMSGYTISFQSLVGVVAGIFIGNVTEKLYKDDLNYRKRNLHGFFFMSLAYFGVYVSHKIGAFLIWTVMLKTSHMFLRIVLTDMLMRRCPGDQTGSVSGTANSVSALARLISPLAAGFVEDTWGTSSANFLAAIITTAGVFIAFRIKSSHLKNS